MLSRAEVYRGFDQIKQDDMNTLQEDRETISKDTYIRYLTIYLGVADWDKELGVLYKRLKGKNLEHLMSKIVSCAILLPYYDKTKIPETPTNLLHWCQGYHQFEERDWAEEFRTVIKRDKMIDKWRNQALSLGVIYPLEYCPVTRQAFNWLYKWASDKGVVTEENKNEMARRFQNLVLAYGGNTICYIFQKHNDKVRKILNWRSGYFFEKLIFEFYTIDQVLEIKGRELKKANPQLIKQIINS